MVALVVVALVADIVDICEVLTVGRGGGDCGCWEEEEKGADGCSLAFIQIEQFPSRVNKRVRGGAEFMLSHVTYGRSTNVSAHSCS